MGRSLTQVDPYRLPGIARRFWLKVVRREGCWEWLGGQFRDGYGIITIQQQPWAAHRVSYELAKGPIPDGMRVCHSCDHPGCVNPEHLWLGTDADNHADRKRKDRSFRPFGEKNAQAKLTGKEVAAIKRELADGARGSDLARKYWVSPQTICDIKKGRIWAQITVLTGDC